jgi:DNA polymerase elongation subunit (family B)
MLSTLSAATNAEEFRALIPKALEVMRGYISLLRNGRVQIEDLLIEKRLSKTPTEYRNLVPQAVAATHLTAEGGHVHAGQNVSFVITNLDSRITANRAIPSELTDETTPYDANTYIQLILRSATNLLLPFSIDTRVT